jgi:hypothetical protein
MLVMQCIALANPQWGQRTALYLKIGSFHQENALYFCTETSELVMHGEIIVVYSEN